MEKEYDLTKMKSRGNPYAGYDAQSQPVGNRRDHRCDDLIEDNFITK